MAHSDIVQLKIKSPSASISDLLLSCSSQDHVGKVKVLVSQQFPSHPAPNNQKLVYSGKILGDQDKLVDILRWEDGCSVFTFHLVCSLPVKPSSPSSSPATTTASESTPSPSVVQPSLAQTDSSVEQMMASFSAQYTATMTNMSSMPSEQEMATMHSLYNQYLALYMDYLQSGSNQFVQPPVNQPPSFTPAPPEQPNDQQQPVEDGAGAGVGPLVMNAGGGAAGVGGVGQEELGGGNRDLLDWVYVMTRVMLLFSVIYFHSSFVRLAFVTGLGFLVYMYQNRRLARVGQAAPRQPVNGGNQEQGRDQEQRVNRENEVNNEQETDQEQDDVEEHVTEDNLSEEQQEQPKPSRLAVLVTFFTTLISSIIPEQNQVV